MSLCVSVSLCDSVSVFSCLTLLIISLSFRPPFTRARTHSLCRSRAQPTTRRPTASFLTSLNPWRHHGHTESRCRKSAFTARGARNTFSKVSSTVLTFCKYTRVLTLQSFCPVPATLRAGFAAALLQAELEVFRERELGLRKPKSQGHGAGRRCQALVRGQNHSAAARSAPRRTCALSQRRTCWDRNARSIQNGLQGPPREPSSSLRGRSGRGCWVGREARGGERYRHEQG